MRLVTRRASVPHQQENPTDPTHPHQPQHGSVAVRTRRRSNRRDRTRPLLVPPRTSRRYPGRARDRLVEVVPIYRRSARVVRAARKRGFWRLVAGVGGIVYDRDSGGPYRVRVVDVDVLAGRGVGWLPWAAADSSHRLHPRGWSHTDRATYAVWWGWSGWCGDVGAPVDVEGLAARAGLRPSTLRRRAHPAGLWNHRGDRLAVARWDDPSLDAHRERVRYDDYRCSVPARSGLEGATVRWRGHTNRPEADTAPSSVNEPLDAGRLWGGLIGYKPSYTTSARKQSSGARPPGNAPKKQISVKRGVVGRGPPTRRRRRWTPERHNYENQGYFGVLGGT